MSDLNTGEIAGIVVGMVFGVIATIIGIKQLVHSQKAHTEQMSVVHQNQYSTAQPPPQPSYKHSTDLIVINPQQQDQQYQAPLIFTSPYRPTQDQVNIFKPIADAQNSGRDHTYRVDIGQLGNPTQVYSGGIVNGQPVHVQVTYSNNRAAPSPVHTYPFSGHYDPNFYPDDE